jgi:hypothetical protein
MTRTRRGDQESAILAVGHTLHSSVQQAWHRIEFRQSGSPSPHADLQSDPQIPFAVLMQPKDAVGNAAQFRVAPDTAIPNFAEFSIWRPTGSDPYRAVMIFNETTDLRSTEFCVLNELAVLPA